MRHGAQSLKTRICAMRSLTPRSLISMIPPPCRRPQIDRSTCSGWRATGPWSSANFRLAGLRACGTGWRMPTGRRACPGAVGLAGQWPIVQLALEADVVMSCQRCLKPVRRKLASESRLVFASRRTRRSCRAITRRSGGDPRMIDFAALVEDELLLGLPLIPRHEADEKCTPPGGGEIVTGETPSTEMPRPFAGLKDLLKH